MKNFSSQYLKLIESMKSSDNDEIFEFRDKDERKSRREERRKERTEKSFMGKDSDQDPETVEGEFYLKSFQKAVESLRDQVIAQLRACDLAIKTDIGNKAVAEQNKPKFRNILDRISRLLGDIDYRREKEGRKLELPDDSKLIKSYRESYDDIGKDLKAISDKYSQESEEAKVQSDIDKKYPELSKKIKEATEAIENAKRVFFDKKTDIGVEVMNAMHGGTANILSGGAGGGSTPTGDLGKEIKNDLPVKVSEAGKKGEVIKKVKQLIKEKFGNNKKINTDATFKQVINSPSTYNLFGPKTQALIIKLKKLFKLKDETSDITQDLIDKLENHKATNESKTNLLSFSSFLNSRINEDNDELDYDAFSSYKGGSSTGSTDKKASYSSGNSEPTPFTTEEEGNAFRKWVNDTHTDWAKKNQLDPSGKKDNAYIRKAYKEFGKEYIEKGAKDKEAKRLEEIEKGPIEIKNVYGKIKKLYSALGSNAPKLELITASNDPNVFLIVMTSKGESFYVFESGRVKYYPSSSKYYGGAIKGKGSDMEKWTVKFDTLKDSYNFLELCNLKSGKSLNGETGDFKAEGKKAYPSGEYTNVRDANWVPFRFQASNLIYKHKDKDRPIGEVIMKELVKTSGGILSPSKDWNWYKIKFPEKIDGYESGWVREDTVELK